MRKGSAFALILLFCSIWLSTFNVGIVKAESKTIVVPDDYSSIQEAVDIASEGDTVYVKKGTYDFPTNQTLVLNKTISFLGENAENTIINFYPPWILKNWHPITPEYGYDNPITIEANNVTFSGFTIISIGSFVLLKGDGIQMMDNILNTGIFMLGNHQNISRNITPWIQCYGSFNSINENIMEDSLVVGVTGYSNLIYENMVTNGNGIHIVGNRNSVFNNTVMNCTEGVVVYGSDGSNNVIFANWLTQNDEGLVLATEGSNNIFYQNYVSNNNIGVSIGYVFPIGENNTFHHNSFVNNSVQVSSDTTFCIWYEDEEGNYWSDYSGIDADGDGIGDTPYIINENNQDNYPIVKPTTIPEFPSWIILPLIWTITLFLVVVRRKLCARKSVSIFTKKKIHI